jgi:hypothetical protein
MTTTNTVVFLLTAKPHQGDVRGQKELTRQNIAIQECNALLSDFVLMASLSKSNDGHPEDQDRAL